MSERDICNMIKFQLALCLLLTLSSYAFGGKFTINHLLLYLILISEIGEKFIDFGLEGVKKTMKEDLCEEREREGKGRKRGEERERERDNMRRKEEEEGKFSIFYCTR